MPNRIPYHKPRALAVPVRNHYERTAARQADKDFYSSPRWRKLRAAFLAEHPLCADCQRQGRLTPANHVHHKHERKDCPELAYDWDNLEAVCQPCHNAKRKKVRDEAGQDS